MIHMGPNFYHVMLRILFHFSNASDESKYAVQKVNMDNYQVTSQGGFGIV
jgi:hypothetical protein